MSVISFAPSPPEPVLWRCLHNHRSYTDMSSNVTPAKIAIVMGSKSDWATMQFAAEVLTTLNIPFHVEVVSAHRTPDKLFSFAEQASANGFDVIIAGAGGAAHLPGMLAAKTLVPVLGVPVQSAALSGKDIAAWRQAQTDEVLNNPDPREEA